MSLFDASGIRKVFDLAGALKDPINLSIGQPDFPMPEEVQKAAIEAIQSGKNGYTPTQGIPQLRDELKRRVADPFGHKDRDLFVAGSGTSSGILLSLASVVNPGDEVIIFDPYFVMYDSITHVVGGTPVYVDTYPDFHIDLNKVADAITDKTKAILFNSPANPTGVVASCEEVEGLAKLAEERDILLISDEIYSRFCYEDFTSPAEFNSRTLVLDGFSKTYAMTGWRVGFAHGPSEIIQQMIKLQQYTFVCAPHPGQYAALAALDVDMTPQIEEYKRKRDMLLEGISDLYEVSRPDGAFYIFPKAPSGSGEELVLRGIKEHGLLSIPGNIFSRKDSHFRLSYAASEETIERGIEALRKLAR